MTPDQIFAKYNGKQVLNVYGAQCEAWAERYAQELGHPIPTANAKDHTGHIDGYTWLANTPELVPQKGDIVVWGTQVGQYGHIAVASGTGNTNSFTSYDQNWPLSETASGYGTGSVHLQSHNYYGVLGVQRPNLGEPVATPSANDINQLFQTYQGSAPTAEQVTYYENNDRAVLLTDLLNENLSAKNTLHQQLVDAQKALADASQRPPEPAQGTITSTSTLQAVVTFFKGLWK